jgi:hypothetical protein
MTDISTNDLSLVTGGTTPSGSGSGCNSSNQQLLATLQGIQSSLTNLGNNNNNGGLFGGNNGLLFMTMALAMRQRQEVVVCGGGRCGGGWYRYSY